MTRRLLGSLALVATLSSACTWKVGGAPPTNYDFSELETYGKPYAESPSYGADATRLAVDGENLATAAR
jgi:hypothetical protein